MLDRLSPEVIDQTPDVTPADVLDQDALLTELAGLSPIAYDQRRASAAKLLGVRVGALDAEVAARRQRQAEAAGAPETGADPAAAPVTWPDAVDGAQLLAELSTYYVMRALSYCPRGRQMRSHSGQCIPLLWTQRRSHRVWP